MSSSEVQYFDSDFSFEEHARDCIALAQQQQKLGNRSVTTSDHPSSSSSSSSSSSQFSTCTNHSINSITSVSPSRDEENARDRFHDTLHPQSQAKFWDAFHTHHSAGKFYKPRRYLLKSFPCIMKYLLLDDTACWSDDNNDNDNATANQVVDQQSTATEDKIVLEIGCGSGSSCIPLLEQYFEIVSEKRQQYLADDDTVVIENQRRIILLACDSSPVAVETTRRALHNSLLGLKNDNLDHVQVSQPTCLFDAFVADPSLTNDDDNGEKSSTNNNCSLFIREVNRACATMQSSNRGSNADNHDDRQSMSDGMVGGDIVGIVLLVFVLSAVAPSRVDRFIQNVFLITKPGGKVCFRDYGLYDMPMLRFESSAVCRSAASNTNDPVFVRGEGTIARFFSVESVREIFVSAGFVTAELRYCTVFNHNRKTGQRMKRVFVHGVFEKPKF